MGGSAWFLDTEKSWDELRAEECGVDVDDRLGIGDCDSVDAMFRQIQYILEARKEDNDGKPLVVVVDSVTGAATEGMKKKEIGEIEKIAQDAKAIRGGMRRIVPDVAELNVNLFMINHATANITANKYAKQSDSSGGHSIKLASTVRCSMKHSGWIKDTDGRRLGQEIGLRVEKLKGSSLDWPEVEKTPLLNTIGFDSQESLLRAGVKSGWIDHKKGSKVYTLYDEQFEKVAWPSLIMCRGGEDKVYHEWLEWCYENRLMSPWGRGLA
jgi:RecA/RadA recombinase